ncbi:unnamed protein product [Camellia sinensis]
MEGRVPPPAVADKKFDLPLPPCARPSGPPSSMSPPPPPPSSETYIVQIPRDQVYRIPPPENARIVETYRDPQKSKGRCGGKCCLWILISTVVLAVLIGITVAIVHSFFNPKTPEFSVTKVLVKNPKKQAHAHPSYEISLKANNPNEKMSVVYEKGGKASLSFTKKQIASGKFPSLTQDAKDSTNVHLTLAGSSAMLPSEVEKSMKSTKLKLPVSLSLMINVPVKLKGSMETSKDLTVTCDFKVSTLASGTNVSSQKCETKF